MLHIWSAENPDKEIPKLSTWDADAETIIQRPKS